MIETGCRFDFKGGTLFSITQSSVYHHSIARTSHWLSFSQSVYYDNEEYYQKKYVFLHLYTMKSKVMIIMNLVFIVAGAKEVTRADKFFDFFDKIDPITTFVVAIINLYLVYIVFRFTQKMSQSKLSLSPEVDLKNDVEKYSNAKVEAATMFEYREEGFPIKDKYTYEKIESLYIRVKNRGDLPSTKINIEMKLNIYKTKITGASTNAAGREILHHERELHEVRDSNIMIDYMGADEEQLYGIVGLYGQVREVELVLIGIRSNGHTYFKGNPSDPTVLYHYTYPYLKGAWDNEDGGKSVYGHIDVVVEDAKKRREYASKFQKENAYYAAMERERAEAQAEFEQEEEERRQREEARFRGEVE